MSLRMHTEELIAINPHRETGMTDGRVRGTIPDCVRS